MIYTLETTKAQRRWLNEHYKQHVDFKKYGGKTDKVMFLTQRCYAHFRLIHG